MTRKTRRVTLSRDELLRDSERQGTSMSLPLAVYHRLDLLTEAAQGAAATRAELMGMLIADAPLDAEELEQAVLRYRKMTVGELIPDEQSASEESLGNVVSIQPRKPGRPARREPH